MQSRTRTHEIARATENFPARLKIARVNDVIKEIY